MKWHFFRFQNFILFRYLITGFITKASDVSFFIIFHHVTSSVLAANGLAALISLTINFTLHHQYTFKLGTNLLARQGIRYGALNLLYFGIDTALITTFIEVINWSPGISKIVATFQLSILGYIFNKYYIFKK